jgi:hypothetical protein
LQGFGGLELQRTAWSADDTQKFAQLARDDGFYRLRLQPGGSGGGHVLASLRARCLAASGFQVEAFAGFCMGQVCASDAVTDSLRRGIAACKLFAQQLIGSVYAVLASLKHSQATSSRS